MIFRGLMVIIPAFFDYSQKNEMNELGQGIRWRSIQVVLLGAEQHQPKMDDADSGLEGRFKSIYYSV